MKYHLGCGAHYMDGYTNVEHPTSEHKADIHADVLTMDYIECDEIRSSHMFEHFDYPESFALLFKWNRALVNGGKLIIIIPDVYTLASEVFGSNPEKDCRVIRYLYGSHEAEWAKHLSGWTPEMVKHILPNLGFSIINLHHRSAHEHNKPNHSLYIESKKISEKSKKDYTTMLTMFMNGNTEFEVGLHKQWVKRFKEIVNV